MTPSGPLVDSPSSSGTIGPTSGIRKLHTLPGIADSSACFNPWFSRSFCVVCEASGRCSSPMSLAVPFAKAPPASVTSACFPMSPTTQYVARSQDSYHSDAMDSVFNAPTPMTGAESGGHASEGDGRVQPLVTATECTLELGRFWDQAFLTASISTRWAGETWTS